MLIIYFKNNKICTLIIAVSVYKTQHNQGISRCRTGFIDHSFDIVKLINNLLVKEVHFVLIFLIRELYDIVCPYL